jgi:hypothetical protein
VRTCIQVYNDGISIKSINMIANGTGILVWGEGQKEFKIITNFEKI